MKKVSILISFLLIVNNLLTVNVYSGNREPEKKKYHPGNIDLIQAARAGRLDKIKLVLENEDLNQEVDINFIDAQGRTPLDYAKDLAARTNNSEVLKYLKLKGAKTSSELTSKQEVKPKKEEIKTPTTPTSAAETSLDKALKDVKNGKTDEVEKLILDYADLSKLQNKNKIWLMRPFLERYKEKQSQEINNKLTGFIQFLDMVGLPTDEESEFMAANQTLANELLGETGETSSSLSTILPASNIALIGALAGDKSLGLSEDEQLALAKSMSQVKEKKEESKEEKKEPEGSKTEPSERGFDPKQVEAAIAASLAQGRPSSEEEQVARAIAISKSETTSKQKGKSFLPQYPHQWYPETKEKAKGDTMSKLTPAERQRLTERIGKMPELVS